MNRVQAGKVVVRVFSQRNEVQCLENEKGWAFTKKGRVPEGPERNKWEEAGKHGEEGWMAGSVEVILRATGNH